MSCKVIAKRSRKRSSGFDLSMTSHHSKPRPSTFVSDVFKLVGGTAFAQALAILASPLITCLYSPEAFGMAAIIISIRHFPTPTQLVTGFAWYSIERGL